MTGFLKQLLAQHFSDPENMEDPFLKAELEERGPWVPDDPSGNGQRPGILIESITRWQPDTTESRPGLIIKRNDWSWSRRIIDGRVVGDMTKDQFEQYQGFWRGSHTIFAISRDGAAAETLGLETARLLEQFHDQIVEAIALHRFVLVGIGALVEIEEATEDYAVPVTVAYTAEERWKMLQDVPRLKSISFKAAELLRC